MPRRERYNDTFTGRSDRAIRQILGLENESHGRELRRTLLKVINNELTARQKEIIVLYYFMDKDITFIGKELGITPQAVSSSMRRSRLKMFRILQYCIGGK